MLDDGKGRSNEPSRAGHLIQERGANVAQYDPDVIEEHSEKLYKRAQRIVGATVVGWGLIATVLWLLFVYATADGDGAGLWFIASVLGGVLGYFRAKSEALKLRLEAQSALAQLQIERNTRSEPDPATP